MPDDRMPKIISIRKNLVMIVKLVERYLETKNLPCTDDMITHRKKL